MGQVRIFEPPSGGISVPMLTAKQVQDFLKLQPLPIEGGYFVETYRSKFTLAQALLPPGYSGERLLSTAIYFLLTPDTFSAMHRLKGDEIYHFYLGDPVEMLTLKPDGTAEALLLGQDILAGMRVQHPVPGGTWQGSRLAPGGKFALLGTTMAPGFDPQDFELGKRADLSAQYPAYAPLIAFLTR
jgi:predicted cupin superfamily sugar epimerase